MWLTWRTGGSRHFYVNMLKQWHTPIYTNYLAEEVDDEEEVPVWNEDKGNETKPVLGDQLSDSQWRNYRNYYRTLQT